MKRAVFFSILGAATATFLLGGTYALATQTGLILGSTANSPDAFTAVTAKNVDGKGGLNGPLIRLTNSSTGQYATPLRLSPGTGRPPFTTDSTTRVPKLNADYLDGMDSTRFVQGGGRMLTSRSFVNPGSAPIGDVVFDHAAATPSFRINYRCPDDPSTAGSVFFNLPSTSPSPLDLTSVALGGDPSPTAVADHSVITADGATGLATDPRLTLTTFDAYWYDGHVAIVRVASYHQWNKPDPRDDGCVANVTAYVK